MSDSNRNATDILLSLESKVELLISLIKVQNFQNKVLSDKISMILLNQPQLVQVESPRYTATDGVATISQQNNGATRIQSGTLISTVTEPQEPLSPKRVVEDLDEGFKTVQFEELSGHLSPPPPTQGSIPFTQRIATSAGKSVFMASIEVFNGKQLIHKTRTNAAGKWSGSLTPGEYVVKLQKAPAATIKKPIDITYPITIEKAAGLLELKDFIIN